MSTDVQWACYDPFIFERVTSQMCPAETVDNSVCLTEQINKNVCGGDSIRRKPASRIGRPANQRHRPIMMLNRNTSD